MMDVQPQLPISLNHYSLPNSKPFRLDLHSSTLSSNLQAEPSSNSNKRSQSTPPDTDQHPRKRSKSLSEDQPTFQNTSSVAPASPASLYTTEKTNSTILRWLDTLQQADAPQISEVYYYSDVTGSSSSSSSSSTMPDRIHKLKSRSKSKSGKSGSTSYEAEWLNKPGFRSVTLPSNSIKILYPDDSTPTWVQKHITTIDAFHDEALPSTFKDDWRRYLDICQLFSHESSCTNAYSFLLNWIARTHTDNWTIKAEEDTKLIQFTQGETFRAQNLSFWGGSALSTLHNPKPDFLFGYDTSAIPPSLVDKPAYDRFRCMTSSMITFPYLLVEMKGHLGNLYKAENQAIIGGRIALDITWPILREHDIVFLIVATPYLVNILVMWREIKKTPVEGGTHEYPMYYVKLITSFTPHIFSHAQSLRRYIFRLQRWARETRCPMIADALKNWEKGGCEEHEYAPGGL
ncbi:hypothetical protein K445DRAFT_193673 [Daldinia sp. EC12]|nr:hypothetical protein F4774DRAFT_418968 [Daldinia eschscholtzii]OTB19343.1 hypothetical protein K445DRAFT_193673 [Daldinia sp. EC12]